MCLPMMVVGFGRERLSVLFFVLSENFHSQIAGDHDGVRRGDLFAAARGT